jgi:hypothetical protein
VVSKSTTGDGVGGKRIGIDLPPRWPSSRRLGARLQDRGRHRSGLRGSGQAWS